MQWSDIAWTPADLMLRQFALLWLGFFLALAAWQGWGHDRWNWAAVLAALALTIGPLGMLRPGLVQPIFVTWMVLAFPIGWLMTHLGLALLYYGVFTPVGLLFRLVGRDVLDLRRPIDRESYWEIKPPVTDVHRYFRQY